MEVGALSGGGGGAALLRRQVLGSGSRGRRVGVRVRVEVHVVLVVLSAVARHLPAARRRRQPRRRAVGGVVAVADVGAAGSSGRGSTAGRVVRSDGDKHGQSVRVNITPGQRSKVSSPVGPGGGRTVGGAEDLCVVEGAVGGWGGGRVQDLRREGEVS